MTDLSYKNCNAMSDKALMEYIGAYITEMIEVTS